MLNLFEDVQLSTRSIEKKKQPWNSLSRNLRKVGMDPKETGKTAHLILNWMTLDFSSFGMATHSGEVLSWMDQPPDLGCQNRRGYFVKFWDCRGKPFHYRGPLWCLQPEHHTQLSIRHCFGTSYATRKISAFTIPLLSPPQGPHHLTLTSDGMNCSASREFSGFYVLTLIVPSRLCVWIFPMPTIYL